MARVMIFYHIFAILVTAVAALLLYRRKGPRSEIRILLLGMSLLFGLALTALLIPVNGFARIQLLAWVVFLFFPLFLLMGLGFFWAHNRRLAIGLGAVLLITLLVAAESFLIEPRWLEVTRLEITSPKLEEPLTIAVLADIQTDSPGEYEIRVLEIVREEDPDLILLAGDYIQERDLEEYQRESEVLNRIFLEGDLSPRMGIYAVRGNVDRDSWKEIFLDLEVRTFEETETIDLGPVLLTGVGWLDSANPALQVRRGEKYHIVLGHSPNFSLGEIEGDLLLAGHTHGGQIQLPGIGPLLTLSVVPRSWASGLTEIQPGKYLLVSRGIGLERDYAPQMRLFCRPEVIFLSLRPAP
ncbi:MAG TPA: hypothetical protein ENG59_03400 [Chloroflexi bacterium]|nr:hypothetical protein [Chloroflexota bacterium]